MAAALGNRGDKYPATSQRELHFATDALGRLQQALLAEIPNARPVPGASTHLTVHRSSLWESPLAPRCAVAGRCEGGTSSRVHGGVQNGPV